MRSGYDPAIPARITARRPGPEISRYKNRATPQHWWYGVISWIFFAPDRPNPALLAFVGKRDGLFGIELASCAVPVLVMPAVRLSFG